MNHLQISQAEQKDDIKAPAHIYVLESDREFMRLEEQSMREGYRCSEEFAEIKLPKSLVALDAGCGSGILSRYLAAKFPDANIIGIDASHDRIEKAKVAAESFRNISFAQADLRRIPFANNSFDTVFCRYVLHHMPDDDGNRVQILRELFRCLKPGGTLISIEPDTMFYNLFPQSEAIERAFAILKSNAPVDLCVGRKTPSLLLKTGFSVQDWSVQTIVSRKELLLQEHDLMKDRFEQLESFLEKTLGCALAKEFRDQFLSALLRPDTIYYCNKVIITGRKMV